MLDFVSCAGMQLSASQRAEMCTVYPPSVWKIKRHICTYMSPCMHISALQRMFRPRCTQSYLTSAIFDIHNIVTLILICASISDQVRFLFSNFYPLLSPN